jgi:hypothetical protein
VATTDGNAQTPESSHDHTDRRGEAGQLAGDAVNGSLRFVALLRPAQLDLAAIERARRPAARRRSRERVRVAPPSALIRSTMRAILPTALASNPESVG